MKKTLLIFILPLLYLSVTSQPISIGNGTSQAYSPYASLFEYTYVQTIYLESEIQGSGNITSLTYYYTGTDISHSDLLSVYLGVFDRDYYSNDSSWFPVASMTRVFDGSLTNYTIPGPVTIQLQTPFAYSGHGNLVISVSEKRPGGDGGYFKGFDSRYGNYGRVLGAQGGGAPVDEYNPPVLTPGYAIAGNIIIGGLTLLPCQSPRNVRFSHISHQSATINWSAPAAGNAPTSYEVYYSTAGTKPAATTAPSVAGIADTAIALHGLQPYTWYYAWVRSHNTVQHCGSVWTIVDSFKTLCTPIPVPTPVEAFTTFLPDCWNVERGRISSNTKFLPLCNICNIWRQDSSWVPAATKSAAIIYATDTFYYWLISPMYNLGTSGGKNLEFDISMTGTSRTTQSYLTSTDTFSVVISTDSGFTWTKVNRLKTWTYPLVIPNSGQHISIDLSSYTGVVRIGFYGQGFGKNTALSLLFLDNVKVSGVLPVKLLAFTGTKEGNTNLLAWRTATEQNCKAFELQRAASGAPNEFATIGLVPTKATGGNSAAPLSYQLTDQNPSAGDNYYRLRQVDLDGKATLSNVVLIKNTDDNEVVLSAIYPNPATRTLNMALQSPAALQVQLVIADMTGKTIRKQTMYLQKGDNKKTINISALHKGGYFIKLVCPAPGGRCETAVSRFVKE